jgi:hypothetical protein
MQSMRLTKRVSRWCSWALVATIVLAAAGAQAVVPVVVGGQLQGATGVLVGGQVYDVQFVEGTCVDLYDGCDDVSDFTFTTLADAQLAGQALFDFVVLDGPWGNFDTVPSLTAGCSGVFCGLQFPYGLPDASNASIVSALNQVDEASDVYINGDTLRTFDSAVDTFHTLTTWVMWTPVPPATQVVVAGKLTGATDVNVDGTLYDV